MNKKIVTCAILSMATLTMVLSSITYASLNKPGWESGDYWRYRTEIYSGAIGANNISSLEEIVGEKNITVNGTLYSALFSKITTNKNYSIEHVYYRPSDMAVIKLEFTGINTSVIYDPPYTRWKYPTDVGDTWEYHGDIITQSLGGTKRDHIDLDYRCKGEENITVPAGEFHCYVIEEFSKDGRNYAIHYVSPYVGNEVQVDSYYNNQHSSRKVLISFSYMGNTTNVTENDNPGSSEKTPDFCTISAILSMGTVMILARRRFR